MRRLEKRLGLNVWSGSHLHGKPQGDIKRMKKKAIFSSICLSLPAVQIMTLSLRYFGFASSGIWLVVVGLRVHLHKNLFSHTNFVYTGKYSCFFSGVDKVSITIIITPL